MSEIHKKDIPESSTKNPSDSDEDETPEAECKSFVLEGRPARQLKLALDSLSDPVLNGDGNARIDVNEDGLEITVKDKENARNCMGHVLLLAKAEVINFRFFKPVEGKIVPLDDIFLNFEDAKDDDPFTISHDHVSNELLFMFETSKEDIPETSTKNLSGSDEDETKSFVLEGRLSRKIKLEFDSLSHPLFNDNGLGGIDVNEDRFKITVTDYEGCIGHQLLLTKADVINFRFYKPLEGMLLSVDDIFLNFNEAEDDDPFTISHDHGSKQLCFIFGKPDSRKAFSVELSDNTHGTPKSACPHCYYEVAVTSDKVKDMSTKNLSAIDEDVSLMPKGQFCKKCKGKSVASTDSHDHGSKKFSSASDYDGKPQYFIDDLRKVDYNLRKETESTNYIDDEVQLQKITELLDNNDLIVALERLHSMKKKKSLIKTLVKNKSLRATFSSICQGAKQGLKSGMAEVTARPYLKFFRKYLLPTDEDHEVPQESLNEIFVFVDEDVKKEVKRLLHTNEIEDAWDELDLLVSSVQDQDGHYRFQWCIREGVEFAVYIMVVKALGI